MQPGLAAAMPARDEQRRAAPADLDEVRSIPRGAVRSYGEIEPGAPRFVGHVLAETHEPVPWHRVVRADGTLPLGRAQRDLLEAEGVPMRDDRVDMAATPDPRET